MIRLHRHTFRTASAIAGIALNNNLFTSLQGIGLLRYSNSTTTRTTATITVSNAITSTTYDNRIRSSISWEQRRGKKKSTSEKNKMKKENRKKNRRPGRFKALQALHDADKNKFFLPAGMTVKHGTTTNNLKSILDRGILPDFKQGRVGRIDETMNPDGVYVASCYLAYRTCLLNFRSSFGSLLKNKTGEIDWSTFYDFSQINDKKDMSAILTEYRKRATLRYTMPTKECISSCGLPVVLNITLKEDVYIDPDEDFLPRFSLPEYTDNDYTPKVAKEVWEYFGSAALQQCIPSNWISSIEFFEPHRPQSFVSEKYSLLEDNVHNINQTLYNKIKAEEDVIYSSSIHKYNKDLEALLLAEKYYMNSDIDPRKKWHQEVVIPRQSFWAFSGQFNVKDSYEILDKLSQNNSLEMLATAYQLYLDDNNGSLKLGIRSLSAGERKIPYEFSKILYLIEIAEDNNNPMLGDTFLAPDGNLEWKIDENNPFYEFYLNHSKK